MATATGPVRSDLPVEVSACTPAALAAALGPTPMDLWVFGPGAWSIATTVRVAAADHLAHVVTGDTAVLDRAVSDQHQPGRPVRTALQYYGPLLGPPVDDDGAVVAAPGMAPETVAWFAARLDEVEPDRRRRTGAVLRLYCSRSGTTAGLHRDGRDGTFVQLLGDKEGWVLPPDDPRAVPTVPGQPNSDIDLFATAGEGHGAVRLRPRQAVDIPEGWWHDFRARGGASVSLAIWWRHELTGP